MLEGIVGKGLRPGDQIYRTISFERLEDLLTKKRNTLVRPSIWPDTFEDLLGNANIRSGMRGLGKFVGAENFYGQCWTLHRASDAIWQIYSLKKDGFRIRTTVGKLLDSLKSQVEQADIYCHIGKVCYMTDKELVDFGKTHFQEPIPSVSEALAKAYMVKRNAFRHENEVRLIYRLEKSPKDQDLFRYAIKPNDLIDQIMVHPQVSVSDYKPLKKKIDKLGFKGEIKRSLLYRQPDNFEFHFGRVHSTPNARPN